MVDVRAALHEQLGLIEVADLNGHDQRGEALLGARLEVDDLVAEVVMAVAVAVAAVVLWVFAVVVLTVVAVTVALLLLVEVVVFGGGDTFARAHAKHSPSSCA